MRAQSPLLNLGAVYLSLAMMSAKCSGESAAGGEQAMAAGAFIESIGFATHFGYTDTPYGFAFDGVKQKLLDLGVHHLRDGFNTKTHLQRIADLSASNIKFCLIAEPEEGSPSAVQKKIKAINMSHPGAVDVIEGPNEPDYFWVSGKKSYGGKNGADGPLAAVEAASLYLDDLHSAFKADPATASIPIMGIALGRTYEPGKNPIPKGRLADSVDWGNFHPYFGGNPFSIPYSYGGLAKYYWFATNPEINIGEFPYAINTYSPPYAPKPMASSEAGCATDTNGASEVAHGKYIPRMFLEYFRHGIVRTYSYELVDEFPDGGNREARFGLMHRDLTPKPAFTAMKGLIHVLSEDHPAAGFKPNKLAFILGVAVNGPWTKTEFVHHLLLEKTNGEFDLIVWHEVSCEDGSTKPRRQFTPLPMPCTLQMNFSPVNVRVLKWQDNGEIESAAVKVQDGLLRFNATDNLTVIELQTKDATRPARG